MQSGESESILWECCLANIDTRTFHHVAYSSFKRLSSTKIRQTTTVFIIVTWSICQRCVKSWEIMGYIMVALRGLIRKVNCPPSWDMPLRSKIVILRQMMTTYIPRSRLTCQRRVKIWALASLEKLSQAKRKWYSQTQEKNWFKKFWPEVVNNMI